MSIETRLSLLARIRDHSDGAAWRDFVAIYEPVIYRHARSRGLQDADAREVTQEVLMSVAASIERFDPERETRFGSWLSRVARNAAIDRIRRRHERGSGRTDLIRTLEQQPERDQDESTRFDLDRRRELFRWAAGRARGRFHATTWKAFWLTAIEGRSAASVAKELRIREGAVYVARCRVLARLRELVAELDEWTE